MQHDETEWTPREREALDRLPREADPGRLLEEKTVAALRARGHLAGAPGAESASRSHGRPVGSTRRGDRPRVRGVQPAWWAAGIAAALALFFGGLALGQARSATAAHDLVVALRTADAAERPSLVQQTGSLYVDAVASLATLRAQGDEAAVGTGVEVGLAALYAAAYEMARLHPEDPRLRQVLEALDPGGVAGGAGAGGATESDGLHWF
jgi:hypothetical protein